MSRLTKKENKHIDMTKGDFINVTSYDVDVSDRPYAIYKLGVLEDIGERLGVNLITLFMALRDGIYFKDENTGNIYYTRNIIMKDRHLIQTTPCSAIKKVTPASCLYGNTVEKITSVEDAHYWSWETSRKWKIEDYGKTWALSREELEK